MTIKYPLLYSYRRCPYAMRARMALVSAQIQCDVVEVDFKNKPDHMLEISPKGTVPVLQTSDGKVIDESLDIIQWALENNDPDDLLIADATVLIEENDGPFKAALDRYKYPNRFSGEDCSRVRDDGEAFLKKLNDILEGSNFLVESRLTMADISIFPFIRQFANVDRPWFDNLPYEPLQNWLSKNIESDLFQHIFKKQAESRYLLL